MQLIHGTVNPIQVAILLCRLSLQLRQFTLCKASGTQWEGWL